MAAPGATRTASPVNAWPWPFLRIAHRGLPEQAPENSLQGFMMAAALGADMVETDVRLSADGVAVLAHDDEIERAGGQRLYVSRTALADLRRLVPGEGILPTLDEALGLRQHGAPLAFNLDIKQAGVTAALLQAVRATGRHDGLLLTGHTPQVFAAVRAQEPWIGAALTWAARLPNAPARALARVLPLPGGTLLGLYLAAQARAADVHALTLEYTLATPEVVRICHRAGLHVLVWTVDDPGAMRTLHAAGVDGITTNRVGTLIQLIGRALP